MPVDINTIANQTDNLSNGDILVYQKVVGAPNASQWIVQNLSAIEATNVPRFLTDLTDLASPTSGRAVLSIDGYSSVNDGGQGQFLWDASYTGPASAINVYPVGFVQGAWSRIIHNNILQAPWFGAKGDAVGIVDGGTDDTDAIQAMLDLNQCLTVAAPYSGNTMACMLPETNFKCENLQLPPVSLYRITRPLGKNDGITNGTKTFFGGKGASSGLYHKDYTGPAIIDGYVAPGPTFGKDTGTGLDLCNVGQADGGVNCWWNFSEYDTGDLTSVGAFTVEWFINPLSTSTGTLPNDTYLSMFSVFGNDALSGEGAFLGNPCMNFTQFKSYLHSQQEQLRFELRTTTGFYTVITQPGHTWNANALNHIAVSYDGAYLRMFIDGYQADTSMTVAATGVLNQTYYESMTFCGGYPDTYPCEGQPTYGVAPGTVQVGRFRFSDIARYQANFSSPAPSTITCDAYTKVWLDFAPQYRPTRPAMAGYSIALSAVGARRAAPGQPVWLRAHTAEIYYTGLSEIHDLVFNGIGWGIYANASPSSKFGENCRWIGNHQGLCIDNFSYTCTLPGNMQFWETGGYGGSGGNFNNPCIYIAGGAQFTRIGPGNSSAFGGNNFYLIHTFADIVIDTCFPSGCTQGVFYFGGNVSSVLMTGASFEDESNVMGSSIITISGCTDFTMLGGYLANAYNTSRPIFRVGNNAQNVLIKNTIFSSGAPLFTFPNNTDIPTVAQTNPVSFQGCNFNNVDTIDGYNPGPVLIPSQEYFGLHAFPFTSAATAQTLPINDFLWGSITFTDAGSLLTGDTTITTPNVAGYFRNFFNGTQQTLFFATATSFGTLSVAAGANQRAVCLGGAGGWVTVS